MRTALEHRRNNILPTTKSSHLKKCECSRYTSNTSNTHTATTLQALIRIIQTFTNGQEAENDALAKHLADKALVDLGFTQAAIDSMRMNVDDDEDEDDEDILKDGLRDEDKEDKDASDADEEDEEDEEVEEDEEDEEEERRKKKRRRFRSKRSKERGKRANGTSSSTSRRGSSSSSSSSSTRPSISSSSNTSGSSANGADDSGTRDVGSSGRSKPAEKLLFARAVRKVFGEELSGLVDMNKRHKINTYNAFPHHRKMATPNNGTLWDDVAKTRSHGTRKINNWKPFVESMIAQQDHAFQPTCAIRSEFTCSIKRTGTKLTDDCKIILNSDVLNLKLPLRIMAHFYEDAPEVFLVVPKAVMMQHYIKSYNRLVEQDLHHGMQTYKFTPSESQKFTDTANALGNWTSRAITDQTKPNWRNETDYRYTPHACTYYTRILIYSQ